MYRIRAETPEPERSHESLDSRPGRRRQPADALRDPPAEIEAPVTRAEFEAWIADDVQQIADCVDRLLERAGISASAVDRVFMTGGSSLVPVVRRLFERRFGPERIRSGSELTSVASGLALRALDRIR